MGVSIRNGLKAASRSNLRQEDVDYVAALALFRCLSPGALEVVLSEATVVSYDRGDLLFGQGEVPRYLHVLLSGEVGLTGAVSDGEETMVEILKTGEAFIAAAVLTGQPYLMSAAVLTPARVLQIPGQKLLKDLRGNPDLAVAMLTSLSKAYRNLVREVKNLKLKSASQRLAQYLMSLTQKRTGATVVRLPHNKGLIASRVGIRAETLSRAFTGLKAVGVEVKGMVVSITALEALATFCQEGEDL